MGGRPKYCASLNPGGPFSGQESSRRAAAWALDVGNPGDLVWTGRAAQLDPKEIVAGMGRRKQSLTPSPVLAQPILEMVAERIDDLIGDDLCTEWTDSLNQRALEDLDRGLRRILIAWLARNGIRRYFQVKDVQETTIPAQAPTTKEAATS